MNTEKFKKMLREKRDTQNALAEHLGLSPQRLSAKVNARNGAEFRQTELRAIKEKYNLTEADFVNVFFA